MRKAAYALIVVLIFSLALLHNSSKNESSETEIEYLPLMGAVGEVNITSGGESDFEIYYGTAKHSSVGTVAKQISDWFYTECGAAVDFSQYKSNSPKTNVILYGRCDLPLSTRLADAVDAYPAANHSWGIAYEGGVLALYATTKTAYNADYDVFEDLFAGLSRFVANGDFVISEGTFLTFTATEEEYEQLLAEREERIKAELLAELTDKLVSDFSDSDFKIYDKGITSDMSALAGFSYPSPAAYPVKGEHPRVMFTADDIPGILEALESEESAEAKKQFYKYVNDRSVTGILEPAVESSSGYHNYSYHVLFTALNKAFAYAVLGEELCGVEAVYIYMNFLKTLDFKYKSNDQCREFGYAIYVGACIYDWCYDLISPENKDRIVMGIEHVLCTGTVEMPEKASFGGAKMEIGFPPTVQGSVDGHGSERQLLQQYLAVSIAIFDEYPGWYEFCAGRIYEDYVDVRNAYYESGMIPQGTYYAGARYISDVLSAVLLTAATGDNPYNERDMHRSYYGTLAHRKYISSQGIVFYVGDSRPELLPILPFSGLSLVVSHLFSDPVARGIAKIEGESFTKFSEQQERFSVAEYLIFSSGGVETLENPAAELPLISYYGGYRGEMVARDAWCEEAAIVIMKVQERTTANHEHQAAGTFQIHYKGMLTGDLGDYAGASTDHVTYFHRATVAHNGLLVYNTNFADRKYYTGGQRNNMSAGYDYGEWMDNSNNDTGTVVSFAQGYKQSGEALFAYLDGDITEAYDSETVDFVGRKMLTVYTGDEESPMLMFIFDRIDSDSPDFKKTFLLQVPGSEAPTIDEEGKKVTVTNGEGKLLLTNILGGDNFEGFGGTDEDGNRNNYLINGEQLSFYVGNEKRDGNSWGRVEISPDLGEKTDLLLNVIQVADREAAISDAPTSVTARDLKNGDDVLFEGAKVGNVCALFATTQSLNSKSFGFTAEGDGLVDYYICGLHTGTWSVSIDGEFSGTLYSTKDGGMVKLSAPAGARIEVKPSADIRPENSGEITYVTNRGVFSKKPFQFYAIGEETLLPTDLTRGTDGFLGWYDNPDFEGEPITHVPADAGDGFTVYARWKYDFIKEDYDTGVLDKSQITYGGSAAIAPEGGSLIWSTSAAGPSIQLNVTAFSAFGETDGVISYEFEFARLADGEPIGFYLRMRDNCESRHGLQLLFSNEEGEIFFGADAADSSAEPILTLTEELQTVRIVVDFNNGKMYTYDAEGRVDKSQSFSVKGHASALDFAEGVTEILGIRANNAGSLRIGKIAIIEGNAHEKELSGNKINYVTNGGEFDKNPPISYTPGQAFEFYTSITKNRYSFCGWYADKALTIRLESLPLDSEGVVSVYAKWKLAIAEEYSDGTLDTSLVSYGGGSNASYTVNAEEGYMTWTTAAANPTVSISAKSGYSYADCTDRVTIEMSLARDGSNSPLFFIARMRDSCSPRCTVNLFSTDASGAVYLGYNGRIKLFDLSDEFKTVKVTVDFSAKTVSAYDEGGNLQVLSFTPSDIHTDAESLKGAFSEMLGLWAGSAGSLRIEKIAIIEGNAHERSFRATR